MAVPEPRTLRAAHDVVTSRRPKPDANLSVWLVFHQSNARMYEVISDVDRGHHHEALYWADYERRKAAEVSAKIQGVKPKRQ
ncbi:MAG TPA: AMED_5909 family protein [Nonomuraea sp.]|nr:AMED_5909 family protein [Nonomuraea sp.]